MAIGLMLPETADAGGAEFAVRAEGRGYESVWQGELWGENSFAEMAAVAERTSDVRIGTGIVNVFSRSPAVLAMGANSLDRLSDGRFVLGVGVSTPKAIEDLHGMSFEQPIRRTHEAVELVRLFTSDADSVDYDGEVFDVADFPGLSADVPVYNAALGPANRRVTARLCDGWLPNMVPYSELESAFEYVAEHAREADRNPENIGVAPWAHVAANDDDPQQARDAVRGAIAYFAGSADGYKNAVASGYPDEAERVADAWRAGNRDTARGHVTATMVDDLGCAGTTDDVRQKLGELADSPAVDTPLVSFPASLDDDAIERSFAAAAPEAY